MGLTFGKNINNNYNTGQADFEGGLGGRAGPIGDPISCEGSDVILGELIRLYLHVI